MTLWISASQASQLAHLARVQKEEQKATKKALVSEGTDSREAQIIVRRMRAEHWPTLDVVVAEAVRRRLEDEDLAGPWEPLNAREVERVAVAGRWPGPPRGIRLVERNYALPTEVAFALRTASWRVSEAAWHELYQHKLISSARRLSESERRHRDRLAERLHSPGRIVRQALSRYGPQSGEADTHS